MVRWMSTVAVLVHLVVNLLHGRAHAELSVDLNSWQQVYVLTVILIAPLVAMVLIWTRYARVGVLLLLVSMLGSLLFGGYFHYVAISPDHVSHLPAGDAQGMFRTTAMLLLLTELLGAGVALWALRRPR